MKKLKDVTKVRRTWLKATKEVGICKMRQTKDSSINWKEGNTMMRAEMSLPLFLEASPVA